MKKTPLQGVLTELVTPFREDRSIDYYSLKNMIDFQVDSGIAGLFVHGISSESMSMTATESIKVVEETVKIADGRISVIANLMCSNKARALEFQHAFEDCGVDYMCACQPLFLTYGEEGLYDYFSTLMSSSKLPFFIYNMPQAGYTLSPTFLSRLSSEFPNFVGYKDSTQDIIHLQNVIAEIKREGFSVLAGSDATTYATLAVGGNGVVSMISLIFPNLINDMYNTFREGDLNGALRQQLFIMKVRRALKAAPLIAGYKTMLKHLDLFSTDYVRSPLVNTRPEQAIELFRKLENLGVL